MPLRAIAHTVSEHLATIASTIGMGIVSGVCYLVGTSGPEVAKAVVLNDTTKIEGSPYALGAIIASVCVATWVVAMLVNRILTAVEKLEAKVGAMEKRFEAQEEKREATEKTLVAVQTHIDDCPIHRRDRR